MERPVLIVGMVRNERFSPDWRKVACFMSSGWVVKTCREPPASIQTVEKPRSLITDALVVETTLRNDPIRRLYPYLDD